MKKIVCVRCDAIDGIKEKWTAYYSDDTGKSYAGEIPPANISRYCIRAKYCYMSLDGPATTEYWMMDSRLKNQYAWEKGGK